jgi:hypothetical protein
VSRGLDTALINLMIIVVMSATTAATYATSWGSATGSDNGYAIGLNTDGTVYVSGTFNSTTMTVTTTTGTTTLTNAGGASSKTYDIFVAMCDASGKVVWIKVSPWWPGLVVLLDSVAWYAAHVSWPTSAKVGTFSFQPAVILLYFCGRLPFVEAVLSVQGLEPRPVWRLMLGIAALSV